MKDAKERSIKLNKKITILIERSILDDYYIFAKMLNSDGFISEFEMKTYELWFELYLAEFTVSKTIYLKTDPLICFERLKTRNRNGESNIEISYLEKCHLQHEDFFHDVLKNLNCLVINNNRDKNNDEYNLIINQVLSHFE